MYGNRIQIRLFVRVLKTTFLLIRSDCQVILLDTLKRLTVKCFYLTAIQKFFEWSTVRTIHTNRHITEYRQNCAVLNFSIQM